MGRNLLLNLSDHGFFAAGYDKDASKSNSLMSVSWHGNIYCTSSLTEFLGCLKKPRSIILLVPAGPIVDSVITEFSSYLEKDDLLIDSGNSYFKDTDIRIKHLEEKGFQFMGMGISGGEEGARNGASIMPGGKKESYERIRPMLEAVAAKAYGEACVAWLGPMSSGHYVKMVHNGIEYAIMQLIAETYALMKLLAGFSDDQLHEIYSDWNETELNSYLIEITANIFARTDDTTGKKLINEILDVSRQKGTGMWASQNAMELHVPVPSIDIAVSMRNMSVLREDRLLAGNIYKSESKRLTADRKKFIEQLRRSMYLSMIMAYAQGFALMKEASEAYGYGLDPEVTSSIWRGGCIVRSVLLNDIRDAFHARPDLDNLLLNRDFSEKHISWQDDLRVIVRTGCSAGIAIPGFMASLGYFDAYRSSWLPANLIESQRDYFGGHTYERTDSKGTYHTEWLKTK
jgi:6-phosphogluconate dehydrogenase